MLFKIALIMAAFAANSVLCRLALVGRHIDPMTFSLIRVGSGAVVLFGLFLYSKSSQTKVQWSLKKRIFSSGLYFGIFICLSSDRRWYWCSFIVWGCTADYGALWLLAG